jgi:hypothetical protein
MLGAAFGGLLLDHLSIAATLIGGTMLLALASLTVGNGDRIKSRHRAPMKLAPAVWPARTAPQRAYNEPEPS